MFLSNYVNSLAHWEMFCIFADMEAKNKTKERKYKTERSLVDGLLAGEKEAQEQFYEDYKGLFFYCLRCVFDEFSLKHEFEDDLVNDFLMYLIECKAKRLSKFNGVREGSLAYYLAKRAKGYFIRYKSRYKDLLFVTFNEDVSQDQDPISSILYDNEDDTVIIAVGDNCNDGMVETITREEALNYLERIMGSMPNRRYAEALRKFIACRYDDELAASELNINIDYWYVLKQRAIKQLKNTHNKNKALWQNIISQMS